MVQKAPVFSETQRMYLEKIADLPRERLRDVYGLYSEKGMIRVPFFNRTISVTDKGMADENGGTVKFEEQVVISRYLLMCPDKIPPENDWTAFRDFKDAGPLTVYYEDNVERAIIKTFSGRASLLDKVCSQLSGTLCDDFGSFDTARVFEALPHVPMLLVFSDADDDFPAACSVLFKGNANCLLDPESLSILGVLLARNLK